MIRIIAGLWLVVFCDEEGDTANILLQQYLGHTTRSPDLVAHWEKDCSRMSPGKILPITIKADCTKVYEVLEGNGKRGTAWAPEYDWYLNGRPYICNSIEVRIEKE